ncbi:MAG: hypothetical protein RLZZ127_386 [Planctomycetota bacterium]|jgi:hypothetical protein
MTPFPWPGGARAALALTYDDCLPCHRETVAPALHAAGIHATFYAPTRPDLFEHAAGWAAVAAMGHELGNHTCFHPCRHRPGKDWGRDFELDDYSPNRWAEEVELASRVLGLIDGRRRRTYGNTCHHETVGPPGAEIDLRPFILERFAAGRGPAVADGTVADPWTCHLGGIGTIGGDGRRAADLLALIDGAIAAGGLLIVTFHAVGPRDFPRLHIAEDEHARLIAGIRERRAVLWTAPLTAIAEAVTAGRAAG